MNNCIPLLWCRRLVGVIGLLAICVNATAQERRRFDERGSVLLGMFVTEPNTTARLDSAFGDGTDIDLENDLGLDSSTTVARLSGYYSLTDRHRLDFSLFEYSRDASRQIDKTIEWGDQVFEINTVVSTTADVRIFKAAYTFVPIVRERAEFGITGGLYTALVDIGLAGTSAGTDESEDLTAPLPVLGVRGRYALSERVSVGGSIEVFSIDAGDANGSWRDAYVGVDYSFSDRIGVGLAYNRVSMNIDAEERRGFQGQLDWGYDGFMLYLKVDFGY